MIKTTRSKIYNFNKPTAVYCQIAVSVLAEIYYTKYGCKPKIKHIEVVIQNNVSYPHQLLSSKQVKSFIFTTEYERFEIQLVGENGNLPYIQSSSFNALLYLQIKAEQFIVKDIEHVKSDDSLKEIYLATLINKTTQPKTIAGGVIHASKITASRSLLWQPVEVIHLK